MIDEVLDDLQLSDLLCSICVQKGRYILKYFKNITKQFAEVKILEKALFHSAIVF